MRTDLLDTYSRSLPDTSRRAYGARARAFLDWLGKREPDAQAVRAWVSRLHKEGYADGTILKEWAIIRRLYLSNGLPWAFHRGEAPLVRESQVYAPALAEEDIKAMVDVVLGRERPQGGRVPGAHHRAFLTLSTIWGLRREEMVEMRPEYLDVQNSSLFVQTAKRGRQRWHTVPAPLLPHLEEWGFRSPMPLSTLSQKFVELRDMIGLVGPQAEELGWHSIRRALVRGLFEVGVPENLIYDFLRWKRSTRDMALRYGSARVVGRATRGTEVVGPDYRADIQVLSVHPFLSWWGDAPP